MTWFEALELFGTAVFAISGAFTAARKDMDIMGVLLLAFLVGNGGGTLRGLLLGQPIFWVHAHSYIWVSFIAGVLAIIWARYFLTPYRLLLIADAIGLSVFVVTGAQRALNLGYGDLIAVLMGVLTAVGGGLLRDLICNEVPLVLRREIYATAAAAGAIFFVIFQHHFTKPELEISTIIIVFCIRLAAIQFKWTLPAFSEQWFYDVRQKK